MNLIIAYRPAISKSKVCIVETKLGEMTLSEVYNLLCKKEDTTPYRLESETGIEHASSYLLAKGKSHAVKTFIECLDGLGYEVVIKKKEGL